jgi:hypothetical protein
MPFSYQSDGLPVQELFLRIRTYNEKFSVLHLQLNLKTGHDPTKGEIKDNTLNCQKQLDISLTFGIN